MCSRREGISASSRNSIFKSIAASQRREILRILLDHGSPVTEQELATHSAVTDRRSSTTDVTTAEMQTIRAELVHAHLPTLENAGLIVWNRDDGTIEMSFHPALTDPRFRLLLKVDDSGLDEALSNLANERRRILLTILRDEETPISRTDLARKLLQRETGETDPDSRIVDDALASLYHVHLPKIAHANLAEYNLETGHAAYTSHPALEEVFTIIYEPNERLVDTYDDFFGGLKAAYTRLGQDRGDTADWPHFWSGAYHG